MILKWQSIEQRNHRISEGRFDRGLRLIDDPRILNHYPTHLTRGAKELDLLALY
jgi:hypothetical protein